MAVNSRAQCAQPSFGGRPVLEMQGSSEFTVTIGRLGSLPRNVRPFSALLLLIERGLITASRLSG
jgi:hypothetical protein